MAGKPKNLDRIQGVVTYEGGHYRVRHQRPRLPTQTFRELVDLQADVGLAVASSSWILVLILRGRIGYSYEPCSPAWSAAAEPGPKRHIELGRIGLWHSRQFLLVALRCSPSGKHRLWSLGPDRLSDELLAIRGFGSAQCSDSLCF